MLHSLVGSLVDFATGLGAVVVAEGVERAEDSAALHDLRVGYGQGWFWGRAVPADLLDDQLAVASSADLIPAQQRRDDVGAARRA